MLAGVDALPGNSHLSHVRNFYPEATVGTMRGWRDRGGCVRVLLYCTFLLRIIISLTQTKYELCIVQCVERTIFLEQCKLWRSQWPCSLRCGSWPVGCWDCGFESRSRHGCLSATFCVLLSYVGRGLATGLSLVQGVVSYV
jgi:hypothetical protein